MEEERLIALTSGLSDNERVEFLLNFKLGKLLMESPTGELRNELSEISILVSLLNTKEQVSKKIKEHLDKFVNEYKNF
jgi:hypothetical protein